MQNNVCSLLIVLISMSLMSLSARPASVYKYKNKAGKWVLTDKKPKTDISSEKLTYATQIKTINKPQLSQLKTETGYARSLINPFHAPVEIYVKSSTLPKGSLRKVVNPAENTLLFTSTEKMTIDQYYWVLGDPTAKPDDFHYFFPVHSHREFLITQGFNGRFSHTQRPSKHAVDIGMQVGTVLSATRAGTVIWVKQDYHMGGAKGYFLDKANYVSVLHDDGTYAMYAHILMDSAFVKPGDTVQSGDKLALSGSSGYSTGPHLHFVIRKNTGLRTQSVAFVFSGQQGGHFIPKRGMLVAATKMRQAL